MKKIQILKIIIIAIVFLTLFILLYSKVNDVKIVYKKDNQKISFERDLKEFDFDKERYSERIYQYNLTKDKCGTCHTSDRVFNSKYIDNQWIWPITRMAVKEFSKINNYETEQIYDFLKFISTEKILNIENFPELQKQLVLNNLDQLSDYIINELLIKDKNYFQTAKASDIIKIFNGGATQKAFISNLINEDTEFYQKIIDSEQFNTILAEYKKLPTYFDEAKRKIHISYGEKLYKYYCASCHGNEGKGGAGNTLNSIDTLSLLLVDDGIYYQNSIKFGRPGSAMVPWGNNYIGIFTDKQIDNIVKYFKDEWYEKNPEKKEITRLPKRSIMKKGASIEKGKEIYDKQCISCHGAGSNGGMAPSLMNYYFIGKENNEPILITDEMLRRLIKIKIEEFGMLNLDKDERLSIKLYKMKSKKEISEKYTKNDNIPKIELTDIEIDSIIMYLRNNPVKEW